jgi:hypothetical protein
MNPAEYEDLLASGMFAGRRQQRQAIEQELIGRTGKLTPESVSYRDADPGSNKRCGTCAMFRQDSGSCSLVAGTIVPQAVCDRYEPRSVYGQL